MSQRACSCGRPIRDTGRGRPRQKCDYCSPPRRRPVDGSAVVAAPGDVRDEVPREVPSIGGGVASAVRLFTDGLYSDHPAGEVLAAMAERLAVDVDRAPEVRDRVAAAKELRAVLGDLTGPAGGGDGEGDDDDLLGGLPPGVGDSATG